MSTNEPINHDEIVGELLQSETDVSSLIEALAKASKTYDRFISVSLTFSPNDPTPDAAYGSEDAKA